MATEVFVFKSAKPKGIKQVDGPGGEPIRLKSGDAVGGSWFEPRIKGSRSRDKWVKSDADAVKAAGGKVYLRDNPAPRAIARQLLNDEKLSAAVDKAKADELESARRDQARRERPESKNAQQK